MKALDPQVALVIGAGRGVGRAVAEALAAQGLRLAIVDITPVNLDTTRAHILAAGGQARDYICDVGRLMPVQTMLDQVLADWGRVDILVNCAAVRPHAALLAMDEWDLRRTLEVNLVGSFFLLQQVGRVMREAGAGIMINLALDPPAQAAPAAGAESAFAASMAGLLALSRSAAQELAGYGIRVHAVQSDDIGWSNTRPVDQAAVDQIVSLVCQASNNSV